LNHKEFIDFVVDKADDMKARDIVIIDVSEKSTVTTTMVVCSGNSKRHVSSIAENVIVECKQTEHAPLSVEGKDVGEWVLVDLGEVVLHVMQDQTRDFYQLEKLWQ
jgi:ribosome-associated protein